MVPDLVWPVWTRVTRTGSPLPEGEMRVGRVVIMVAVGRKAAIVIVTARVPAGKRAGARGAERGMDKGRVDWGRRDGGVGARD